MTALLNSEGILGVAGNATDSYTPPACLLAGSFPVDGSAGIVSSAALGADLPAFSLVGRITGSGKLILSVPGASDGSQIPVGITSTLVKASGSDQNVWFYRTGKFNYAVVNKDAGWTLASLNTVMQTSGADMMFSNVGTATPTEPA